MLDYKRAKGSSSPRLSNQQPIPTSGFLSGLPNSALLPAAAPADSGLGEKMRLRLPAPPGQNPAAEAEADRLSKGVQASTPEGVKSEMGRRLGADLSGVRLHTGGAEAERADHMGANAFTVGRDVYFGSGGFRADTAAHEMVHTVQQGAVEGGVSVFVPMGSIQMQPEQINLEALKDIKDQPDVKDLFGRLEQLNGLADSYSKCGEKPEELEQQEKLVQQWDVLRQELIGEIGKHSNDPKWTDVLKTLQTLSGTTYDDDLNNFKEWLNDYTFTDEDNYFINNTPAFASVSQIDDEDNQGGKKDAVGSIYFGDIQGLKGGRIRLAHEAGPAIELFDHVFRYSWANENDPPELAVQAGLMGMLTGLWPDLTKQKDPLALPKELAKKLKKFEKLEEIIAQTKSEDIEELSDDNLGQTLGLLEEGEQKQALQEKLGSLDPQNKAYLMYLLNELGKNLNLALDSGLEIIDYTKWNGQGGGSSKNHYLVEYVSKGEAAGSHISRGGAKADEAVTNLKPDDIEALIGAVRYSMQLRDEFMYDERQELLSSIKNNQQRLEFLEQLAADRANNFLYAFMSKHGKLKNITQNFKPNLNSNYYKSTSDGKEKKEEVQETEKEE